MEKPALTKDLVVAEVLTYWPQTTPVFVRQRLICVGCVMARFESLEEIAAIYGLDLSGFLHELQQAIDATPGASQAQDVGVTLASEVSTLDVRQFPPARRHFLIFRTFEALQVGEAFVLVDNHDPEPLYYQFRLEREGQFTWDYLEQGPGVWRVRIGRTR